APTHCGPRGGLAGRCAPARSLPPRGRRGGRSRPGRPPPAGGAPGAAGAPGRPAPPRPRPPDPSAPEGRQRTVRGPRVKGRHARAAPLVVLVTELPGTPA